MKSCLTIVGAMLVLTGCQSECLFSPKSSSQEATAASFNSEGAPTVQFAVPDMMCEFSCLEAVKKTLAEVPGAKEVQVEFATKTATVAIDESEFSTEAALESLIDKQFMEARVVGADSETAPVIETASHTEESEG